MKSYFMVIILLKLALHVKLAFNTMKSEEKISKRGKHKKSSHAIKNLRYVKKKTHENSKNNTMKNTSSLDFHKGKQDKAKDNRNVHTDSRNPKSNNETAQKAIAESLNLFKDKVLKNQTNTRDSNLTRTIQSLSLILLKKLQEIKSIENKKNSTNSSKELGVGDFVSSEDYYDFMLENCKSHHRFFSNKLLNVTKHKFSYDRNDFSWIKKWGFGHVAYFFDNADEYLLSPIVAQFKKIWREANKLPKTDDNYKDPFLFPGSYEQLKIFLNSTKFNQRVYEDSINTVQVKKIAKDWHWPMPSPDKTSEDEFVAFIKKYDINGDSRLNRKELILAAIVQNSKMYGKSTCLNCFDNKIFIKLENLFHLLDCDGDGYVSSEDMWYAMKNFQKKKGNKNPYDIFDIETEKNIKTAAYNDLVLKNWSSREGYLNEEEFIRGIFLGYWDRQVSVYGVDSTSELSDKKKRWTSMSEDEKNEVRKRLANESN